MPARFRCNLDEIEYHLQTILYLWLSRRRSPIERRLRQLEEDLETASGDLPVAAGPSARWRECALSSSLVIERHQRDELRVDDEAAYLVNVFSTEKLTIVWEKRGKNYK